MAAPAARVENRQQRRRERTQEAILAAAETAFREHGFAATTVESVAGTADVAVGSIYHHFGNKEALFLAVVERALEVNASYMAEAYEREGTALERLLAASAAYLRFYTDYPFYFRTVALPQYDRRGETPAAAVAERIADRVEGLVGVLETLIGEAVANGDIARCDPHLTAQFCWAAWNGVVATSMRGDRLALSDAEVQAVLAEGQRILLQGLGVGGR